MLVGSRLPLPLQDKRWLKLTRLEAAILAGLPASQEGSKGLTPNASLNPKIRLVATTRDGHMSSKLQTLHYWLVQDGAVAKIRAKRAFCMGDAISQVPKH